MQDVWNKLNYKGQSPVFLLEAPEELGARLAAALPDADVLRSVDNVKKSGFILLFATRQEQLNRLVPLAAGLLEGDGLLWIAYPKGSSKRYQCDFNRDNGFQVLGNLGFEPVRQVAIDEDWSALRFRRVEFIKTMTRSFAMSEGGKKKTAPSKPGKNGETI